MQLQSDLPKLGTAQHAPRAAMGCAMGCRPAVGIRAAGPHPLRLPRHLPLPLALALPTALPTAAPSHPLATRLTVLSNTPRLGPQTIPRVGRPRPRPALRAGSPSVDQASLEPAEDLAHLDAPGEVKVR